MRVRGALLLGNMIRAKTSGVIPRGLSTTAMTRGDPQKNSKDGTMLFGLNVDAATAALRRAEAVCFDVDSTVIPEEGVDVLAEFKGQGKAVAEVTSQAMGGSMDFRTSLEKRLSLIKPAKSDFEALEKEHPVVFSQGVRELIDVLHTKGTHVYLVSGGFRQMINRVADILTIPYNRIYANNILFAEDGSYAGYDTSEPTSSDGGKAVVVNMLKEVHGYKTVVMIGDGATDMQARPPADAFIGYGGTAARENVMAGADLFVLDFHEVIRLLK